MKGQTSLEYLIIMTVILGALLPLVFLSFQYLDENRAIADANSAYNIMSASINQAFSLTPGSKITTRIYLPKSYRKEGSSLTSNILTLQFNFPNGDSANISRPVDGEIIGQLPDNWGYQIFTFELLDTNQVEVSYLGAE